MSDLFSKVSRIGTGPKLSVIGIALALALTLSLDDHFQHSVDIKRPLVSTMPDASIPSAIVPQTTWRFRLLSG